VSTHIARLLTYLDTARVHYEVWDHSRVYKDSQRIHSLRRWPLTILRSMLGPGRRVLYYPITRITAAKTLALVMMRLLNLRLVLMLVASYEQTIGRSVVKRSLLKVLMRATDHIVVNNAEFHARIRALGGRDSKLAVLPAFIPESRADIERRPLDKPAQDFCRRFSPLVLMYAYGPDRHDGTDLYGLDMALEMLADMREKQAPAGLAVVLPEITDADYYQTVLDKVKGLDLADCIYFARGDAVSFSAFLEVADVFIRPTNTDGDALTVREALAAGVPTVASDVCCRPEGVYTFKNRDRRDMENAVQKAIDAERTASAAGNAAGTAEKLIDIFHSAFSRCG